MNDPSIIGGKVTNGNSQVLKKTRVEKNMLSDHSCDITVKTLLVCWNNPPILLYLKEKQRESSVRANKQHGSWSQFIHSVCVEIQFHVVAAYSIVYMVLDLAEGVDREILLYLLEKSNYDYHHLRK
jgi:hypothetical protein